MRTKYTETEWYHIDDFMPLFGQKLRVLGVTLPMKCKESYTLHEYWTKLHKYTWYSFIKNYGCSCKDYPWWAYFEEELEDE